MTEIMDFSSQCLAGAAADKKYKKIEICLPYCMFICTFDYHTVSASVKVGSV